MHQAGVACSLRETAIGRDVLERVGALMLRACAIAVAMSLAAGALAQDAANARAPTAQTTEHESAAAREIRTADERVGTRERKPGRRQSAQNEALDVAAPAALAPDAAATATNIEQRVQRICRERAVTGTRFTRRECMTAEQWAEVDARQASQGRRLARDVQSQSATVGAPGEGGNTPDGRPSGLPNPGGL